jgi:YesN/AraC family two-component response regulator
MITAKELYANTKNLDLLFVEDDEQLRAQMYEILYDLFHTVALAENGQIGLEKYEQRIKDEGKPYDLVITDINMPIMNGIDMTDAIYEITSRQPVLVISAHNESDYLLQLLHIGVNGFLIKPLKHQALINTLHQVTQAINNERLVISHYKKIEQLNVELSLQREQLKKSNDELYHKNLALEKSMRIIEGMHHKDQLYRNINISAATPGLPSVQQKDIVKKQPSSPLDEIEQRINDISQEYDTNKTDTLSFDKLSEAVKNYAESLPPEQSYASLVTSLSKLSQTINEHPKCTRIEENRRIFSMLESFFFIYSRWEKEWSTIDTGRFTAFSHSISEEIDVLIDVWQCES